MPQPRKLPREGWESTVSKSRAKLLEWLTEALRTERSEAELRHNALLEELATLVGEECDAGKAAAAEEGVKEILAKLPEELEVAQPAVDTPAVAAPEGSDVPWIDNLENEVDESLEIFTHQEHKVHAKHLQMHALHGVHLQNIFDEEWTKLTWDPKTWVTNPTFDTFFCSMIVLYTCVMAFDMQYQGLVLGHRIGYPNFDRPGSDVWPGASKVLRVAELIFGTLFVLEVVVKIVGVRIDFIFDCWNWFDLIIVMAWICDQALVAGIPVDASTLRTVRLVRLLRLLRLVRKIQGFDALYVLTTSLRGSLSVLCWSFLLILLIQLGLAFLLNQIVSAFLNGSLSGSSNIREDVKWKLFEYFGSCSRALLTMFELALANWPPVARLLQEELSEWFCVFAIAHKVLIGFSVIGVVNGVFMQETFKVANNDDAIMMRTTEKNRRNHVHKMSALFQLADSSGDGFLSRAEFIRTVNTGKIRTWLAAQEFQTSLLEGSELFELLCGDDDRISVVEFVDGIAGLKGYARSLDIKLMMRAQMQLLKQLRRDGGDPENS
eukprot:TRINITY_DN22308_c0_g1_i1.p1 TRINITY_DN22308_c0_g1~~TRINITY_DN22308_c0_g1_i1.p1  ORF type:complete len:560 (-),score=105.72 TRINITY_DN22308_c0_g1_i1:34-1680(-)